MIKLIQNLLFELFIMLALLIPVIFIIQFWGERTGLIIYVMMYLHIKLKIRMFDMEKKIDKVLK